jgi:hypothetical protein
MKFLFMCENRTLKLKEGGRKRENNGGGESKIDL